MKEIIAHLHYQVLQMGIDDRRSNESSLYLYWWISAPKTELEFLPSISKVGESKWKNDTWMDVSETEHLFTGLNPFTEYNMTVYVRIKGTSNVFPPAKYVVYTTREGKNYCIEELIFFYKCTLC